MPEYPSSSSASVRVWDLPTRLFHWLLAASVVGAFITAKIGDLWIEWHLVIGQFILALLLFRLVWGIVGGTWSRFSRFAYGPSRLSAYLAGKPHPDDHVGHSPLGALAVWALLGVLLAQATLGLFSYDDIAFGGPLVAKVANAVVESATRWHKRIELLIVLLVALHIVAIAVYSHIKKRHLVAAMVTGDKTLPASTPASKDTAGTRFFALLIFAASCFAVYAVHQWGMAAGL